MLKKLLSIILVALPLSSFGFQTGWYYGAGVGANALDFFERAYIKQDASQQQFSVINEDYKAAQGVFLNGLGGYGYVCQHFYLAGEGNLQGSTARFRTSNKEFDHPEKQVANTHFWLLPEWGLSGVSGFILPENTLVYARFGYVGGVFRLDTSDSSLANTRDTLSGIRYGLGIEKTIYCHLGLRFEYSHLKYQSSKIFHVDSSNGAITPKQTIITPESNQFELGLIYRFC